MIQVHIILLFCLTVAAVLSDLASGRIPNGIVAAGLACGAVYRVFTGGAAGIVMYLGGAVLPILFFGALYYFRMIGAGDIKLLSMAGGFLGPTGCFGCIIWSIMLGGLISLAIMLRRHEIGERLAYFAAYVSRYAQDRQWRPYMSGVGDGAKFCFSVPILLGILCQIGGNV